MALAGSMGGPAASPSLEASVCKENSFALGGLGKGGEKHVLVNRSTFQVYALFGD